jgi:hypothetical protein
MTSQVQTDNSYPAAAPAQGTVDTQTKYRDRPSDDGKYGDAGAQPRPEADKEDAARGPQTSGPPTP